MPSKNSPVYSLDTCVVLDALIKDNTPKSNAARTLLSRASEGSATIVISTIVLAEIYHIRGRIAGDTDTVLKNFFANDYFHIYHVYDEIAVRGRLLRRELRAENFPLKTPDALIVATALEASVIHNSSVMTLFTRDGDGEKNPSPILGLSQRFGEPKMIITTPLAFLKQEQLEAEAQAAIVAKQKSDAELLANGGTPRLEYPSGAQL